MDKLAVLIPCYNEAQTVEKVVRDFRAALPEAVIYVYDNNSKDETSALAAAAGAVVRHEYTQGKGNVIRRMFREVDAECYIMADGDDTYPAESAPDMVRQVLERGADMVVGDRLSATYFTENKRRFHNGGNMLVRKAINLFFHSKCKDILTGMRAFSYRFAKTFPVLSSGFEIETEMTIHAVDKKLRMENVVIDYRNRPAGSESKLNTVSDGLRVLRMIFVMIKNYKPFAFFTAVATVLLLFAAVLMLPVLAEYFRTYLVPRYPTLIASGFLSIAALQSFFGGLILDNICRKNRQDFELRLLALPKQRAKDNDMNS
ncbi:MAG: glycosyltransferase family 2 protein [Oscillospiraceae bacterium]|jgi:glycosyltransferase involved in cell wall biosynthesis|nr:glycosyltransferase family 2 protein [Oscillospiraceae bacterium]